MALTVIVAYDISSDSRRARVSARLQRWGRRVQYSVFSCTLDRDELPSLLAAVDEILDPNQDSLMVIHQCAGCQDAMVVRGQSDGLTWDPYWCVL